MWVGRCGECQSWGTVVEAAEQSGIVRSITPVAPGTGRVARRITEIDTQDAPRRTSGVGEFGPRARGWDRARRAILLSGEPGVGKSTLLLEVAAQSACAGRRVLYASGEESAAQVRLRAERTGACTTSCFSRPRPTSPRSSGTSTRSSRGLLIVDSVQTVSSRRTATAPRSARAGARSGIRPHPRRERAGPAIIIVGHVTKDGSIAGPRILEHLVDVVCHFEGDRQTSLRFVRAR